MDKIYWSEQQNPDDWGDGLYKLDKYKINYESKYKPSPISITWKDNLAIVEYDRDKSIKVTIQLDKLNKPIYDSNYIESIEDTIDYVEQLTRGVLRFGINRENNNAGKAG